MTISFSAHSGLTERLDQAWWTVKTNSTRSPSRDVLDLADFDGQWSFLRHESEKQIKGRRLETQVEFWTAPRANGISRFVSIADVVTRTTLQWAGLSIDQKIGQALSESVVSRPGPTKSALGASSWYSDWSEFLIRTSRIADNFRYVIVSDFSRYFDSVSLTRLRTVMVSAGVSRSLADITCEITKKCTVAGRNSTDLNYGLPQTFDDTSSLLGNLYLKEFDDFVLQNWQPRAYARWMDDIVLGVDSDRDARLALAKLGKNAKLLGLDLNPYKTRVLRSREISHDYLHMDIHRRLDEFELEFAFTAPSNLNGRLKEKFSRLARVVRKQVASGSGELLLRRLYGLATIVKTPELQNWFHRDLVSYPNSAAAIANYLNDSPWNSSIEEGVSRYLADNSYTYETVEVMVMLSVLRKKITPGTRRSLAGFANRILSGRTRVSTDISVGIAALLLLRCEGRKANFDVKARFTRTESAHAQRFLYTAMLCSSQRQTIIEHSTRKNRKQCLHLRFLREYLRRFAFDYEQALIIDPIRK